MSPYSLKDIEQYLHGKLPPAEMHAIEKAALQDPFLADAIEGYRTEGITSAQEDLASIHDQLHATHEVNLVANTGSVSRNRWWQAAAAIFLVAGATVLGWNMLHRESAQTAIAQNKQAAVLQKKETAIANIADTAVSQRPMAAAVRKKIPQQLAATAQEDEVPVSKKITSDEIAKIKKDDSLFKIQTELSKGYTVSNLPGAGLKVSSKPTSRILVSEDEFFSEDLASQTIAMTKKTDSSKSQAFGLTTQPAKNSLADSFVTVGKGTVFVDAKKFFGDDASLENNTIVRTRRTDSIPFQPVGVKSDMLAGRVAGIDVSSKKPQYNRSVTVGSSRGKSPGVNQSSKEEKNDDPLFGTFITSRISEAPGVENEISFNASPKNGWTEFNRYLAKKLSLSRQDLIPAGDSVTVRIRTDETGAVSGADIVKTFNSALNTRILRVIKSGPAWNIFLARPATFSITLTIYRYEELGHKP